MPSIERASAYEIFNSVIHAALSVNRLEGGRPLAQITAVATLASDAKRLQIRRMQVCRREV
jgi:hypothetical protein